MPLKKWKARLKPEEKVNQVCFLTEGWFFQGGSLVQWFSNGDKRTEETRKTLSSRESHIVSILYRTAVGYALHNGAPASVSSFEAASADLLFMYERARTTPTHSGSWVTHTGTTTTTTTHVHVVATLSETNQAPRSCPRPGSSWFSRRRRRGDRETQKANEEERRTHIHRNRQRERLSAAVKAIFRQSSSFYREYVISGPPRFSSSSPSSPSSYNFFPILRRALSTTFPPVRVCLAERFRTVEIPYFYADTCGKPAERRGSLKNRRITRQPATFHAFERLLFSAFHAFLSDSFDVTAG